MEEMKTKPEELMTEPHAPTNGETVASASAPVESSVASAPTTDEPLNTPKAIQPRPAPPMDWKRFGAPISVLMTLTIALVLAIQFMPRPAPVAEGQTLAKVPQTLGDWTMLYEYPMSEAALNELKPDEYIARIYVSGDGTQADLSIIGGSHTGAFHNPQVCFRVQNWEFVENQEITLTVGNRQIPARFVRLLSLDGLRREAVGIYFYSTPMGYRPDTSTARILLLLARLTGMDQQRAYFVRFLMTSTGNAENDRKRIQHFAEQALNAMAQTNPEVVR